MKEVLIEGINPSTNERVVNVITVINEELLQKEVDIIIMSLLQKDNPEKGQIALKDCTWKVNGEIYCSDHLTR